MTDLVNNPKPDTLSPGTLHTGLGIAISILQELADAFERRRHPSSYECQQHEKLTSAINLLRNLKEDVR